jgi:ubiquitin carboxyl-terminal hydrolase 25/28
VIQSLFYLPAFRHLVLNYVPSPSPPPPNGLAVDERQRKINEFMQELRKLFSLMVCSKRKYVDPSKAVELLRGNVGGSSASGGSVVLADNNQQDVSEFTHLVLEWVEDAFKKPLPAPTVAAQQKEPEEVMMEDAENEDPNKQSGARFTNAQELFLTRILNAILNRLRIDF